mmetsp:Transcript_9064/g.14982  ORF Transcript_9064/g.14982 Transcript_9064/m.14982 type:complete len:214 (-) Transcript_9064:950-1591(-)
MRSSRVMISTATIDLERFSSWYWPSKLSNLISSASTHKSNIMPWAQLSASLPSWAPPLLQGTEEEKRPLDYIDVESPIGHDQVHQKARRMGLPKIREVAAKLCAGCYPGDPRPCWYCLGWAIRNQHRRLLGGEQCTCSQCTRLAEDGVRDDYGSGSGCYHRAGYDSDWCSDESSIDLSCICLKETEISSFSAAAPITCFNVASAVSQVSRMSS